MDIHTCIIQLVAILIGARILGEFAGRFSIPPVIGEICAGILIGPSLLGLIDPNSTLRFLAEIGIILLLFDVGTETDIAKLLRTGYRPFLAAVAGVIVPMVGGFFATWWFFSQTVLVSLFVGGTLTATSIGITMRVLADLRRQNSHEAQIVLGAAVLDDVIGVILLAILYNLSMGGATSWVGAGSILLWISVFMVLAPLSAQLISFIIQKFERKSQIPGVIPATIVSLILFFSWTAYECGAPELLGGFAAGLALTPELKLPFHHWHRFGMDHTFLKRIESQMKPIVQLFAPIFFVMVGLSLNLRMVEWSSLHIWTLTLTLLIVAVVGKLAAGYVLFGESKFIRKAIGIAMIPRGEVGLIFAEMGRMNKIFDNEFYAALIIVVAVTTLVAPFALKIHYRYDGI